MPMMIQDCGILLSNLDRLEALEKTGLFGTRPEEAFTRLNYMATKLLKAPISIFSLIGENSQFFKSASGFEITNENSEMPIDVSVCQYSLQGKPLSIEDTKGHPLFSKNPAVLSLNIAGYLGIPVVTKSGHAIGAVCVIDHEKRVWTKEEISILEDITASFICEIELRQAVRASEEEARLREEFIAIASHELKNPLSSLKLQTQLINKRLGMGRLTMEDNEKFLSNLERQTKRLELMIDDMSDATRLATGNFSLYKAEVNLNSLLQNIIDSMSETFLNADNIVSIDSQASLVGNWDGPRLEQIFTNLLSNAVKYAGGSPIQVILEKNDKEVLVSIIDHGQGISEENQKKLFTKYGRVSQSSVVKGLGLGLYISRQIAEAHGGSLNLVSENGKGANFIVSLPL